MTGRTATDQDTMRRIVFHQHADWALTAGPRARRPRSAAPRTVRQVGVRRGVQHQQADPGAHAEWAPGRGQLGPGARAEVPYVAVAGYVTSTYPATVDDPGTGGKIMVSTVTSAAPAVSCARAAGAASRRQGGLRRARMGGCGG